MASGGSDGGGSGGGGSGGGGATVLAVIGGSSLLKHDASVCAGGERVTVDTEFGDVLVHRVPLRAVAVTSGGGGGGGDGGTDVLGHFYFVQRHLATPDEVYAQPALINARGIATALAKVGVTHVVAFGSTGTCSSNIRVGDVVVPDDYFNASGRLDSCFTDYRSHFVPALDEPLRATVVASLDAVVGGSDTARLVTTATYCQTPGPRFETKAEVRWLATVGDLIGMTCAREATLCQERGLRYALVCMVDNVAHGFSPAAAASDALLDEFHAGTKANAALVERIVVAAARPCGAK